MVLSALIVNKLVSVPAIIGKIKEFIVLADTPVLCMKPLFDD